MKIIIVVSVEWAFLSHRLELGNELLKRGHEVTVVGIEERGLGQKIEELGFKYFPLKTTRSQTNILNELLVLRQLYSIYKQLQPDIVHHVTLKPVAYGGVVARLLGIKKVINAITGFGTVFIKKDENKLAYRMISVMLKLGYSKRVHYILQNDTDFQTVSDWRYTLNEQIHLIKGSGVNLTKFAFSEPIENGGPVSILFPARMLKDKGIYELIGAAKPLKAKYGEALRFVLSGDVDKHNLTSVSEAELASWTEESSIMNFRALNVRDAHERPEAMEEASVMMVGLDPERIMQGLIQLETQNLIDRNFRPVADYSMPNVGVKVVRIILSYTSYINRVVWQKN